MNERMRESIQSFKAQLGEILRKALMHPKSEELYNRWLQYPERTRKRIILGVQSGFVVFLSLFLLVGGLKVFSYHWDLWKGHDLLETLVNYQIRSGQLEAEKQALSAGGGIYSGELKDLLDPVVTGLQINPSGVRATKGQDEVQKLLKRSVTTMEFDRLTVKQLVEILHSIENAGPNLKTQNLTMTLIERGWYKTSFQILQTLPKGDT